MCGSTQSLRVCSVLLPSFSRFLGPTATQQLWYTTTLLLLSYLLPRLRRLLLPFLLLPLYLVCLFLVFLFPLIPRWAAAARLSPVRVLASSLRRLVIPLSTPLLSPSGLFARRARGRGQIGFLRCF